MRVLLAYSGGLDTSYLVAWLIREQGCEVTALTVDCGGFSAAEKESLASRAKALGAVEHRFVDARAEMFERVLRWLVAANVRRGGVYPLSVGAERGLQAELLAREGLAGAFDAVAHGCTAAGNDQVRFEAALSTIAPGLKVLAPVRDLAPSRDAQRAWLSKHGLPVPPAGGRYSVNAGLWGLTIGGGEMSGSSEALPESAWQWTQGGGGDARLWIDFERGVPVALDGRRLSPVELIERLNLEGGRLGVGRGYHLGDTVLGIKGRIAFEAPAAEILLDAHRELEKLVLTEDQRFWKDHLGDIYGRRLHQGLFHDPFQRDLEAFFASSQSRVSGSACVRLAGRAILVEGVRSDYSLLAASDARYGERPATGSDASGAVGLARVLAEPARLHRRAGETAAKVAVSREVLQ
ncbi:MAG: argininosuccinate synthase [Planctomycetes bacterium]|jgi:argininosuccinate synthase|nr:argininosuccinate synthase [Planctomycetota bacterium]